MAFAFFCQKQDAMATTIIKDCLDRDWKDYEDSTQYMTAQSVNADVIVTRNKKKWQVYYTSEISRLRFLFSEKHMVLSKKP